MKIILSEKINNLGNLGDIVQVKPGYARNYLLPQGKAIRATKDNIEILVISNFFCCASCNKRSKGPVKPSKSKLSKLFLFSSIFSLSSSKSDFSNLYNL